MKVAAPPGFMFAAPGSGFSLVICTGHGPLTLDLPDHKGAPSKSKSDAPCAFAGHAAPPTPAFGAPLIGSAFSQRAELDLPRFDLVPGRGLAAPPPPAQGPPTRL